MEITEKAFAEFGVERWRRACDHVEMIDLMKATDLGIREQGEYFVIYMYVSGFDDSGVDTAEGGSSIDTASESEAFH